MSIEKILIVDDELIIRNFLSETLRRKNFDVSTAENGAKALALIKDTAFDLIFTDMKMPDVTGIDILRKTKEISPSTIVVIITAFGSIENAVEAMHLGAFNYLIKPFSPDTIEAIIKKAREHLSLLQENSYLRQQISGENSGTKKIIGESAAIKQILSTIPRIAKSNANVFIYGESGTGKEIIAQAIHYNSPRASRPFIKVNCAAIPDTLIESEFFGHEKGSFTGADVKRIGRFELADGGSLLLDEVTEIPPLLQSKLLRVIQEHELERVGGTKPIKVDVRLISTSNRNIKEAIDNKLLREDLYYRLNVVPIFLPPLRERKDDIIPLTKHFLEKMCPENHKERKVLTQDAIEKLLQYNWPGNIRELANVIERAIVMVPSQQISADHIFLENDKVEMKSLTKTDSSAQKKSFSLPIGLTLEELEKKFIIETLHAQNNNRKKAAEQLGISIRTLQNKLQTYNYTNLNKDGH